MGHFVQLALFHSPPFNAFSYVFIFEPIGGCGNILSEVRMMKIINELIQLETGRQNNGLELIASENFASQEVRAICGSILTNKYA